MKTLNTIVINTVCNGHIVSYAAHTCNEATHVYTTIEQLLQAVLDSEKGKRWGHVCVVEHGNNECILADGSVCPMASSSHVKACRGCLKYYDSEQPAQEPADEVIIGPHNLHEAIDSAEAAIHELRDDVHDQIKPGHAVGPWSAVSGDTGEIPCRCTVCGIIHSISGDDTTISVLRAAGVRRSTDSSLCIACDKCRVMPEVV